MFCNNCGKENPAGSNFCSQCGHKMASDNGNMTNQPTHSPSTNENYNEQELIALLRRKAWSFGDVEFQQVRESGRTASVLTKISNLKSDKISIPEFDMQGFPLVRIGNRAFYGNKVITEIVIPNGVTSIGSDAFAYCSSLTSITLPDSVKTIENGAFHDCNGLTSITIPGGVQNLGALVFFDCKNLTSVTFSPGAASIGKEAFKGCTKLTNVTIPASMDRIEENAFCLSPLDYLHLRDITYTGTTERWKHREFWNVSSQTQVTCSDGVINPRSNSTSTSSDSDASTPTPSSTTSSSSGGCYVATCVYGSYDCPQVWTLRRFRDETLGATWYGRAFIRTYYAISPTLVKWFGKTSWFKRLWQGTLDKMVAKLNRDGVADTPYQDQNW